MYYSLHHSVFSYYNLQSPVLFAIQTQGKKTKLRDFTAHIWAPRQGFVVMIGDFDFSVYDFKYYFILSAHYTDFTKSECYRLNSDPV